MAGFHCNTMYYVKLALVTIVFPPVINVFPLVANVFVFVSVICFQRPTWKPALVVCGMLCK